MTNKHSMWRKCAQLVMGGTQLLRGGVRKKQSFCKEAGVGVVIERSKRELSGFIQNVLNVAASGGYMGCVYTQNLLSCVRCTLNYTYRAECCCNHL